MTVPARPFARAPACAGGLLFGDGVSGQIGDQPVVRDAGAILVLRSASVAETRSADAPLAALASHELSVFDGTGRHVPADLVRSAVEAGRNCTAELIVTIGGGSTIGLGKAVSIGLGAFGPVPPHIAIPTTYSGSEQTSRYGVTEAGTKQVRDDERARPVLAVYDPALTVSLPPVVTAESGMNALAHCIEILMLDPADPEAKLVAERGVHLILEALPICVARGSDRNARAELMLGALLAARAVVMTRTALHHALCHVLGGRTGLAHGALNAVLLSYVVEANAETAAGTLDPLADALDLAGGEPGGVRLARFLRALNGKLGLSTTLAELGVARADLAEIAAAAFAKPQSHRNPTPLRSPRDIQVVLERAWAGGE